jgi:hypothetical protein
MMTLFAAIGFAIMLWQYPRALLAIIVAATALAIVNVYLVVHGIPPIRIDPIANVHVNDGVR